MRLPPSTQYAAVSRTECVISRSGEELGIRPGRGDARKIRTMDVRPVQCRNRSDEHSVVLTVIDSSGLGIDSIIHSKVRFRQE